MDCIGNKVCSHCKAEKSRHEFWALKESRDGLQHSCKECKRAWRGCEAKKPRVDVTGQRFDSLVVIGYAGKNWLCKCDCGRECVRGFTRLTKHKLSVGHSCGKCKNWRKGVPKNRRSGLPGDRFATLKLGDISGQKLGSIHVVSFSETESQAGPIFTCICSICNKTREIAYSSLTKNGGMKSCGCMRGGWKMDLPAHLMAEATRLQGTFGGIKGRCLNPSFKQYDDYGGRGITIHKPWLESLPVGKEFVIWVLGNIGPRPSEGHQLDRMDNDGNYEPGNLRWATRKENMENRRKSAGASEYARVVQELEMHKVRAEYYQKLSARLLLEMAS
jgi:hypothetical protein